MIVIFGGSGSLGNELTKLAYETHNVCIVSRDELKQKQMAEKYPDIKFILGDVASDEWKTARAWGG